MRRDVFQGIADPNRRAILALLANQRLTLNGLAQNFAVSRPAISRHIRILAECGLVAIERKGREHICEARFDELKTVSDWVEQYRQIWADRLDQLDQYLNELQAQEKRRVRRKRSHAR